MVKRNLIVKLVHMILVSVGLMRLELVPLLLKNYINNLMVIRQIIVQMGL